MAVNCSGVARTQILHQSLANGIRGSINVVRLCGLPKIKAFNLRRQVLSVRSLSLSGFNRQVQDVKRTRIKRLARKPICFSKSTWLHDIVIGLFINRYEFGRAV